MAVIDGDGMIMGRLASHVAQRLLANEEINIVNAEKIIVTGSKVDILARYGDRRKLGGTRGKGPYYPRLPDQLMKRTVRGMLPYRMPRGRIAFKNLKVYRGVPKEFEGMEIETMEIPEMNRRTSFMTLADLSRKLGGKV